MFGLDVGIKIHFYNINHGNENESSVCNGNICHVFTLIWWYIISIDIRNHNETCVNLHFSYSDNISKQKV